MGFFERYLSLWVALAITAGVITRRWLESKTGIHAGQQLQQFLAAKAMKLPYNIAAPACMIGTSNFFN